MVPGINLLLAHALSRQYGRARRVRSAGWLLQIVVEGLQRVAHRCVVEEPDEELRIALRELDRQAGGDTAGGPLGAAGLHSPAGRLHVGGGRTEPDDMDVGEHSLGHDPRSTYLLAAG